MAEAQQQSTQPNGAAVPNAPRKARKQRINVSRYPACVNFSITQAMAESIERLCPPNGPFTSSTILRLILHEALLARDPAYARAMTSNGDQANA